MAFKKPDLNAPRCKNKYKDILHHNSIDKFFKKFKTKYPKYENIDNELIKKIILADNEKVWKTVISNREGIELRDSLGYIFIGTYLNKSRKNRLNVDYGASIKAGVLVRNKNYDTDGHLAKIFYTNYGTKYRVRDGNLWKFKGTRAFTRELSKVYKKDWKKYIDISTTYNVSMLFKKNKKKEQTKAYAQRAEGKSLITYNEFNLD